MTSSILVLLVLALVVANLPFFSERLFFLVPLKGGVKAFGWRLLEWLVFYFLLGGVAYLLEAKLGAVQHQRWEFYTVTVCLFLVLAFPGFIYRYLWRRRSA